MRRSSRLPAMLALLLAPALLPAATTARIHAIASETRVELPRSVSPRAQKATDLGEAPPNRQLTDVSLHFSLTAAQQTALTQLLIDQQNPSSPRYHHWLTPSQFDAHFGLASTDLAKVTQWLSAQGLTVASSRPNGSLVSFSGTVAQVEQALGTSIHSVSFSGEQHIANVTNPHLPAALAAVVSGVTGLSDFHAKPRLQHNIVRAVTARPEFTSSATGLHFLTPGDIYAIYGVNPLLTSAINGAGVTIAVVGETDISIPDVAAFRSAAGLAANNPTIALVGSDPGTSSDSLLVAEGQLDLEWSGALAPNASIIYVNSTNAFQTSLPAAITGTVLTAGGAAPPIISISFGLCENSESGAILDSYNVLFQRANAQGQTIVGPAGDSGATDCDYQSVTAADGLAVDFPASSPFVTAVGGTTFNEGTGTYWTPAPSPTTDQITSAVSYIPEMVWNDSGSTGLSAGGGGFSIYFSKPSWQIGTGVPNDFSRDVPDVSFSASPNHDPYLICSSGSCTNGFRFSDSTLNTVGGTSVSTPIFAGMLALVEQKIGSRIGNANPVLYGLANSTYASSVYNDVTVGNNESACVQGSPNCPSGGSIGYTANAGYDLASGWGSVNAVNLATYWLQATPAGGTSGVGATISATTVSSTAATCGISTGTIALTIQVANDSQTTQPFVPGGTVQILVDNVAVGTAIPLSNGAVSYTLNTAALTSGGHTVSAAYSGDTTYSGSKGALPIDVVSSTQPDFSVTPCNATVQVLSGGTATGVTYTVNAFNGFTGSVAFSVSADASLAATYGFSVSPVVIASGGANGTTVLTLTANENSSTAAKGNTHQLSRSGGSGGVAGNRVFYTAGSGIAVASLLLLTLPRRRRWAALLAAVVSVSVLGTMGCGSSSGTLLSGSGGTSGTPTVTNTAPGTYNVTVTGIATSSTGTTLVHSAVLQFVVQ